ncbi:MAG: glycosyltransferase family 2 protein [Chloroflexi bacterium]|nr:glycosyltransferase family 2 protein [Chloroflexota bacterium]
MESAPQVTILILNWNAQPYLSACLQSVLAQQGPTFQVWLVDNQSTDGSLEYVRSHFPQVKIIALDRNLGFAGGNNAALRQVDTPLVVLLNPDVVVEPDWLQHIIHPLVASEDVGMVGCKLFYPDGRLQHVGGIIRWPQGLAGHIGHLEHDEGQYETMKDVPYVIAAAAAFRRSLLSNVGFLDEGYFLYYEDADWCERIRRAGLRVVVAPQARLVHLESVLTGKNTPRYWRNFHRGRWRFLLKHLPPEQLIATTFPAEEKWLATRSLLERHAAADAYQIILNQLPAILQARRRDGGSTLSETQTSQIQSVLQALKNQAWQSPHAALAEATLKQQKERAEVRPRPFSSRLPFIGPLITLLRTTWNRLETESYVRPLRQQQNQINHLIIAINSQYLHVLHQLAQETEGQTTNQTRLRQDVQTLRHQIEAVHQQLLALTHKVNQL